MGYSTEDFHARVDFTTTVDSSREDRIYLEPAGLAARAKYRESP